MLEILGFDLPAALGGVAAARGMDAGAIVDEAVSWPAAPGIRVVSERLAFDKLEGEWRALEATADGAVLFQSFAWCRAVWDHHLAAGHAFRPAILTLTDRGRLAGLLPLQITSNGVTRTATGFSEPFQQYTEVVVAPDAPLDATARLLDSACRLPRCDGLELLKVRDDSPLARILAEREAIRSNEDGAPFVDLKPFPTFEAYHATVNAKTRKNIRNARNRMARTGVLTHRVLSRPDEVAELVDRAHKGRERWLAENGLTSRAFRDASFAAFTRAVSNPNSGIRTLAMSLMLDDQPVADQWGFLFNGRYYAYAATWKPEFEEQSPGKLHLEEVIRACHANGAGVADFLMPAVRYKLTWTDKIMPVADYAIPVGLRARLQFSVWSATVRPFLKGLALRLPAGVRAIATRLLLRR